MNSSRLEKLAPLTGVVSVLMMLIGSGLLGIYDYLPPAESLQEIFNDNPTNLIVSGYFGLFSAIFLMWFAGSIYSTLCKREGGEGRLSRVFGGGVASGISLGIGFSAILSSGTRAGAVDGISPFEAVALYDLYGTILGQMTAFPTFLCYFGFRHPDGTPKPAWEVWVQEA